MARTQGSHSGITGPRVRRAALGLFARHGYAAVSMRQIAAQVGVQAGALYNYTPDKQTLLFDLMRAHLEELLSAWDAQPCPDNAVLRLERFTRFHIRFHSERPEAVFIAYMELRNLDPGNFDVIEGLRRNYETRLEDILREGVAEGTFRIEEPRIATMALIALLNGVNTWFRAGGRLSLEQIERIHWDMVRGAVSG